MIYIYTRTYINTYITIVVYPQCSKNPLTPGSALPQELDRLCQPEISEEVPAMAMFWAVGRGWPGRKYKLVYK